MRTLGLGVAADDVGVGGDGSLHCTEKQRRLKMCHPRQNNVMHTLGVLEVDDVAIVLEHVHLLNGGDVVHSKALQGGLEALVIGGGGLVLGLLLPAHGTLATGADGLLKAFAFVTVCVTKLNYQKHKHSQPPES